VPESSFEELKRFLTAHLSTLVRTDWLIDGIVEDLYRRAEWT